MKFYVLRQAHSAGGSYLQQGSDETFNSFADATERAKERAAAGQSEYVVVAEHARVRRQVAVVVTHNE